MTPMTTMATLVASFQDHLRNEGKAPGTIKGYKADLKLLAAHLVEHGIQDPAGITTEHLTGFLYPEGHNVRTAGRRFSSLRSFFGFLRKSGTIQADPLAGVSPPANREAELVAPSPEAIRAVIDHAKNPTDRAMLELLAVGLTPAEVVALNLPDLDVAMGSVNVRHVRDPKRRRVVPLPENAVQALEVYLRAERPRRNRHHDHTTAFLSGAGARPCRQSVWAAVDAAAKSAGVSGVTAVGIRAAYIVSLARQGFPGADIQTLAGHKSSDTTRRYLEHAKGAAV